LNVTGCYSLLELYCDSNQFTNLDVTCCKALEYLHCSYNRLTSLNVTGCAALKALDCANNQLVSLNLSTNKNLSNGYLGVLPPLMFLDLSNMPTLCEVCVWGMPFPPADKVDQVDITGSPNVFFTTDCTVTDADGNVYNTVTIGTQIWMAENLRTTKLSDGTDIPLVADYTEWRDLATPGYCWYDNIPVAAGNPYGALYNGYAAHSGKLCPAGWYVPTGIEWSTLTDYLGGGLAANGKLKETGTNHWLSPNTGATNESGFTGLPGGYRYFLNHDENGFENLGSFGFWYDDFYLYDTIPIQWAFIPSENSGFSVRCLMGSSTSITNTINSEEVILYPNPAKEKLYISNSNYAHSIIMILDLQGKKVLSKQMDSDPIDISNLEKGVYVVKLVDSENVLITKFVKE
jgi:uncharacterized protein (TIGR02145 family)